MTSNQRLVRRFSAVLLVLWVGLLAGLLVRGQLRRGGTAAPTDVSPGEENEGEDPILRVHKGFVYADTLGVEPNFRIATRETVQFASGWYEFRDIEVSMYSRGAVAYGLVAETARFNQKLKEARATGAAQVSLGQGVVVRAAGFVFRGADRVLESSGPVTFAGPGWGGVGGGMRCTLADNLIEILGGVSVALRPDAAAAPAFVLLAPNARYSRDQSLVAFPEGFTVLRGGLRLRSGAGELRIDENAHELRRVALSAPVLFDGTLEGGARLEGTAGATVIEPLGGGRYRVTAEGSPETGWVWAHWSDPLAGWREVSAWHLVGEGSETTWEWLEGQGMACAIEARPREAPSRIEGERMRVGFVSGQPVTMEATGSVLVASGERQATGAILQVSVAAGSFTLSPGAGDRVVVSGPEGEARCDRIEGDRTRGAVARGHVVGQLRERAVATGEGGAVRFAAERAAVDPGAARIVLEGEARLWQGSRLVRADRLDYLRDGEQISGRGQVLTSARQESGRDAGSEFRVRARAFEFSRVSNVAVYEGDVVLEDPRADSSCQRLVASLGERGEIQLATLEGGVAVKERANDRVLRGQRARLSPSEDVFEVWGSPVHVQEPSGNQIKAEHLRWLRASDSVEVVGGEDKPTETLYHPEKPPPTRRPLESKPPRVVAAPRPKKGR